MAIDWTKVEGYREDMTAEEKLALLESHEPASSKPANEPASGASDDNRGEPAAKAKPGYVSKAQFDKVASELATAKKALRSKMTEDEAKEADRIARQTAMEEELDTLRREKTISTYKASYLGLGFDDKLAAETAEAMADGDMERVFANIKKNSETQKKAWAAEAMKNTPAPPAGEEQSANLKKLKETNAIRVSMGLPEIKM